MSVDLVFLGSDGPDRLEGERVRAVQCRAPELFVGGSGQLPEVEQMNEVRRAAGVAEELRIAGAAGDLRHHLVRAEPAERPIQGYAGPAEPIFAQVRGHGEGILGLGHRVQVPAVQLTELLPKLADVEPQPARKTGPVGVALLDTHVAVLQAHEDLRVRVRVEGRLESDFELARVEVVTLDARLLPVGAHVPRHADLRVELSLVALPADEPRGRGVLAGSGVATPGGGP